MHVHGHTHTDTHIALHACSFLDSSLRRCSPSLVTRWVCIPGHLLSKLNISQHLPTQPHAHTRARTDTRVRLQTCFHPHLLQPPREFSDEESRRLRAVFSLALRFWCRCGSCSDIEEGSNVHAARAQQTHSNECRTDAVMGPCSVPAPFGH